jgi:hypothetical protein
MKTRTLHLNIDRIVVEGLSPADQRRFASALESRLRAMADSGIADHFTRNTRKRIAALNVGQLRPGATAAQAADQVTASILQSIAPNGQPSSAGREARKDG